MDPRKEIEMKQHVLEMLKNFMMGEESKKFKPKEISVEMIGKPKESLVDPEEMPKEDMADMDHDMEMHEGVDPHEDMEDEDEEETKKPKMSLKDFLANRA